jgi:hypothetical protein
MFFEDLNREMSIPWNKEYADDIVIELDYQNSV